MLQRPDLPEHARQSGLPLHRRAVVKRIPPVGDERTVERDWPTPRGQVGTELGVLGGLDQQPPGAHPFARVLAQAQDEPGTGTAVPDRRRV